MSLPPGLAPPAKRAKKEEIQCPYLDTINRHLLDFDFEKVCSQSLSTQNVYSCLVCGKFFQGRGPKTHAYTHATLCGHHMFAHLDTCKIYCLPDNYEVVDSSLDDVIRCLRPSFTPERIEQLDQVATLARDVHGVAYLPGFCGPNNLKKTDYINVVVHQLAHVRPLRDFFLDPRNYKDRPSPLVREFGALLRKIWSRDNFKSVVSPHELVQEVTRASKLRFKIGTSADAADFLVSYGVRGLRCLHIAAMACRPPNVYVAHRSLCVFSFTLSITTGIGSWPLLRPLRWRVPSACSLNIPSRVAIVPVSTETPSSARYK